MRTSTSLWAWIAFLAFCSSVLTPSVRAENEAEPHMVAFFTTTEDRCPGGWKEATEAQGRLILGTTDSRRVRSQFGVPMKYTESPVHGHQVADKIQTTQRLARGLAKWNIAQVAIPDRSIAFHGAYDIKGQTVDHDPSHGNVPYHQMLICEEIENTHLAEKLPGQVAAFFAGKSCPSGWESLDILDGRFALPSPLLASAGQVGKSIGEKLSIGDPHGQPSTAHRHKINVKSSQDTQNGVPLQLGKVTRKYAEKWTPLAKRTIKSQKISTSDSAPDYPIVEFLACYKKDGEELPRDEFLGGLSMFFLGGLDCPAEWRPYIHSRGSYLVGLPEMSPKGERVNGVHAGGSPLQKVAMPTHVHGVDLTLDIKPGKFYGSGLNNIFTTGKEYGKGGLYPSSGTTLSASVNLPFVSVTHCHIPERDSEPSGERAE